MNKLISKIVGACLGLSLATGVGVGVAMGQDKGLAKVEATGTTVTWDQTTALPETATAVDGDANVTIKTSSSNTYTSPIRIYKNDIITINVASGYTLESVAFYTTGGSYLAPAQNATVTPSTTPTTSGNTVTWSYSSVVRTFILNNSSAQTRVSKIDVTYSLVSADVNLGSGVANFSSKSSDIAINAQNVTGNDTLLNEWTITTTGTASFTANTAYYQVGSSSKPASSINFLLNFGSELNVTAASAKFGGFSGTAGTVAIEVGSTTIGSGSLNGSNDVIITATTVGTGASLSVTVTNPLKGVKAYYISYTLTDGEAEETHVTSISLGEDQALAKGQTYQIIPEVLPADATNKTINYSSSDTTVATVSEDGLVSALGIGTATIYGESDDNSSATDSITITVSKEIAVLLNRGAANSSFEAGHQLSEYFTESENTLIVKYSDNSSKRIYLNDPALVITLADVEITPSYVFEQADAGKKIVLSYTEDGHTVTTNINVKIVEPLVINSTSINITDGKGYILVDDVDSTITGAFTSLHSEPTLTAVSSNDEIIDLDSSSNTVSYDPEELTGTFEIVLLAAKAGVATITITLASNGKTASCDVGPIVVRDSDPSTEGDHYEKVTSNSDITTGYYLLVDEYVDVAFNGGANPLDADNNYIDVTISNNKIAYTASTQTAQLYIDISTGFIKTSADLYIGGASGSNKLYTTEDPEPDTPFENTVTYSNGSASIVSATSTLSCSVTKAKEVYTYRFRYAKAGSTIGDGTTGWHYVQLYKYVAGTVSGDFDKALEFVNTFMHTEISVTDEGTGQCISAGWYTAAKAAFINEGGSAAIGYLQNAAQRAIVADSFSDYFARLQAWAAANGEVFELSNGDYVVSTQSAYMFPAINNENNAAVTAVIVVMALTVTTVGAYFFLRKKKEEK